MYDAIYAPRKEFDIIKKQYPEAVFEDASDCVHEERFGVRIDSIEQPDQQDAYYEFIIKAGLGTVSLCTQLFVRDPEFTDRANKLYAKLVAEKV